MTTITEDYVSFETARMLKEKEFYSENCFAFYKGNGEIGFLQTFGDIVDYDSETCVIAPTIQMACKWLREVHKIFIVLSHSWDSETVTWAVQKQSHDLRWSAVCRGREESYEQATEAAIKYCLENLI